MTEPWDHPPRDPDSDECWPTPEELEREQVRLARAQQKQHEASVKKQRMRMKPMDRSNVVPSK